MEKYLIKGKDIGWQCKAVKEFNPAANHAKIIKFGSALGIKGIEVTDQEFSKIIKYVPNPDKVSKNDFYAFEVDLANNIPDRSIERFKEPILKTLANTALGKGFLIAHKWDEPGFGTMYEATVQKSEQVFNYKDQVMFKMQWLKPKVFMGIDGYTIDGRSNEDIIKNIERGIIRFASIGFRAPRKVAVYDSKENFLYYEIDDDPKRKRYAETLEGSFVWLGAQYNAGNPRPLSDKALSEMSKGISFTYNNEERKKIFTMGKLNVYLNLIQKEIEPMNLEKKNNKENPLIKKDADKEPVIIDDEDFTKNVDEENEKEIEEETAEEKQPDSVNVNINVKADNKSTDDEIEKKLKAMEAKFNVKTDDKGAAKLKLENEQLKKTIEDQGKTLAKQSGQIERMLKLLETHENILMNEVPRRKGATQESEESIHKNQENTKQKDTDHPDFAKVMGSGSAMVRPENE